MDCKDWPFFNSIILPTSVFMIQVFTPPPRLFFFEKAFKIQFFFPGTCRDTCRNFSPSILLIPQRSLAPRALANPGESDVSAGEKRPPKTPNHITSPVLRPPTAGLRSRLFLMGGTCPRTSSLFHEGGVRRGWGCDTHKQLSLLRTATYLERKA